MLILNTVSNTKDNQMRTLIATRVHLALTLLLLPVLASAGSNPWGCRIGTMNDCVTGDLSYDSLVYHYLPDAFGVDSGPFIWRTIDPSELNYHIWRDITIEVSPVYTSGTMEIHTALDAFSPVNDSAVRTIFTEQLTLNDTVLDSAASWSFGNSTTNTNNSITLNNSTFRLSSPGSVTFSDAPLTLNAVSGDNAIDAWALPFDITAPTTFNISPGATFTIRNIGTDEGARALNFRREMTLNADNAAVTIEDSVVSTSSNVVTDDSSWNFTNGSSLTLSGSATRLTMDKLNLDNSALTLGRNTKLVGNEAVFTDATVNLGLLSEFSLTGLTLSGANTFTGNGDVNTVSIDSMDAASLGTTLTLNSVGRMAINSGLILDSNLDISLEDFSGLIIYDPLFLNGGSVSVSSSSSLLLETDNIFDLGGGGQFNASDFGRIIVAENAVLPVSSTVSVDLSSGGSLNVFGTLKGDGEITVSGGSGYLRVGDAGILSPNGDSFDPAIGTLSTDARISFFSDLYEEDIATYPPETQQEFLSTGLFDGGGFVADIMVDTTGNTHNDLLEYGNGGIYLAQLGALVVNTMGSPSATELDGKEFTLIAAKAGKTGSDDIELLGQDIPLFESGRTPALVDFRIVDRNTNGYSDVTLLAEASYDNLLKNPLLHSKNQKAAANLLIYGAKKGNSAITSGLDSLTNAKLQPHMDLIHAEPYSSYMTVSLEHSDMIMNTVLSHATSNIDIRSGRSKEITDQQTRERFWVDAQYREGNVKGSGDLGSFNYNLSSLTIGLDLTSSNEQTIGAYFSYGTQEMDEHDSVTQGFNSDVYHMGAYLNRPNTMGWDLRGVLGYGYVNNESKRQIMLPDLVSNASADYEGHNIYAGAKATIDAYKNDWVMLRPEVGVSYIYYTQESFEESGDSNLSLALDSTNAQAIIASAGVNAHFASLSDTVGIYPLASVRYEHDFYANRNNEHDINASLVAHQENKQTFIGQSRGENALIMGLGVSSAINSALQINGGLTYSDHSHGDEWGAGFTLEYNW